MTSDDEYDDNDNKDYYFLYPLKISMVKKRKITNVAIGPDQWRF